MDASPGPADGSPVPGPGADPGPAADPDPTVPGSLGPHPERHPDDLPPTTTRRRVPSGVRWAIALAVVVLAVASWTAFSTDTPATGDVARLTDPDASGWSGGLGGVDMSGQPVPTGSYTTFDGSTTDLGAHRGTPVVVNLWASTCPPCITEMPAFEQVHQQLGDQVAFVGLAVSDQEDAARDLARRTGVSYELGFDPSGSLTRQLGGVVLPTTVVVGADGTILETHSGALDEDELRALIQRHVDVDPPAGADAGSTGTGS